MCYIRVKNHKEKPLTDLKRFNISMNLRAITWGHTLPITVYEVCKLSNETRSSNTAETGLGRAISKFRENHKIKV
ncbi:hypothetical protein NQ318_021927 [Aromia moschata]|uniref:Uncharacterized protein n=1 Tax=Aromia moschata TaxID=1265417 RepID=A0AAV8XN04_9CUCU|nr:hypothetical protein NQ318_021927 [Aromia moschata]